MTFPVFVQPVGCVETATISTYPWLPAHSKWFEMTFRMEIPKVSPEGYLTSVFIDAYKILGVSICV